jgi:hypothetical protein
VRNYQGVAVLRADWDRLSPVQQRIRSAVEEYMLRMRYSTRKQCVIRFRRFADYLRLSKDCWPAALDRFFTMNYPTAERMVDRFMKWVVEVKKDKQLLRQGGYGGFVRLTEYVEKRGVTTWRIKQALHRRAEREWEGLPHELRSYAEVWLRHQAARRLLGVTLSRFRIAIVGLSRYLTRVKVAFDRVTYEDALG